MTKQTGTIITAVVGILALLCCTIPMCIWGALVFTGAATWNTEFGSNAQTGAIPAGYGVIPCCLSILVLIVPLLLWLFLVRGKENNASFQ